MSTDRIVVLLLAACVITLCFGEVHATLVQKPHSEIFDATLGSLVGYCIGRATTLSKEPNPAKPTKPARKGKSK